MFLYLLLVCAGAESKMSCQPPQQYTSHEACVRVGNAYKRMVTSPEYYMNTACVQVRRTDVR